MSNAPAETLRRVYFYIVKRKVALSGVKDRAEDYDIGLLGVFPKAVGVNDFRLGSFIWFLHRTDSGVISLNIKAHFLGGKYSII